MKNRKNTSVAASFESMESRLMLSGSPLHKKVATTPVATPTLKSHYVASLKATPAANAGSSVAYGKTPMQIRGAYGLGTYGASSVTFNGVQADGRGQTIAIIDQYDFPTAAADLNAFSSYFGLPTLTSNTSLSTINSAAGPTFTKVSQTGSTTSLPTTDPSGPYTTKGSTGWEGEEALDIEWAHVTAPLANIVLVETNNGYLYTGVTWARSQPGIDVVSMSFSSDEYSSETGTDADFTTPAGHLGGAATSGGTLIAGGITFLSSAGDSGAYGSSANGEQTKVKPQYPASSPNVVAVGGTSLTTSGSSYVSEKAWGNSTTSGTSGGGGGGISAYESIPGYQVGNNNGLSTTKRTYPDVALDADPNTGVPIYDSYDFGATTPWVPGYEGGTSLSSPLMAGIVADADQGRASLGLGSLDGKTQTLPRLYQLSSGNFHDVTTGNNYYAAGTGYDLTTGLGTSVANVLIPDLAGGASVAGHVYVGSGQTGLAGVSVYLDVNNNGIEDATEPTTVTTAGGAYSFASYGNLTDILGGLTGTVRLVNTPSGGYVTSAVGNYTTAFGSTSTDNITLFATSYTDATAGDDYSLRLSPTSSTTLQVLDNGVVTAAAPVSAVTALSFSFTGADDVFTVDASNGNPVPTGGITLTGGSAANGDTLSIVGSAGNDAITVNAGGVVFGGNAINFTNVPNLAVDPGSGTDSLTVNAGLVTVPAAAVGSGLVARTFSNLKIAAGAEVDFATAAAHTDRSVVVLTAGALNMADTASVDLGGNDLIAQGGDVAALTALIAKGYAGGTWAGATGIRSSAAAADVNHLTALGVASNSVLGNAAFDNRPVDANAVLVKFTYYGDSNLDGTVDGSDYSRIDNGSNSQATGWVNGDFNYDSSVDGSDYSVIDNTYNMQGNSL